MESVANGFVVLKPISLSRAIRIDNTCCFRAVEINHSFRVVVNDIASANMVNDSKTLLDVKLLDLFKTIQFCNLLSTMHKMENKLRQPTQKVDASDWFENMRYKLTGQKKKFDHD
ncbi:hypothetical protein OUZ56_022666 [Daphnia magna]|uniref:Uncharacterized protein n=1 Tax=Daphnia magna TaxID=35525 RepID=A0ABR0AXC8_9CRUS|nr:hypothetical protein OUZ56_022666 [Daphnia magna]